MRKLITILIFLIPIFAMGLQGAQDTQFISERQLLKNPGFEGSKSSWTASGGAFAIDASTPLGSAKSATWDPSATSQTLCSELVTPDGGMKGRSCQALIGSYVWDSGVEGEIELVVLDEGGTALMAVDLTPTSGGVPMPLGNHLDCPDPATKQMQICLRSTADAASIEVDDLFLGKGRNEKEISQAEIFGTWRMEGVASCQFVSSIGTWESFPEDADCNMPTAGGKAKVSATLPKSPRVEFDSLPAGKYEVVFTGRMVAVFSSTITQCQFAIYDGTNRRGIVALKDSNGAAGGETDRNSHFTALFEYGTAQTNANFRLQTIRTAGDGSCNLSASNADSPVDITVKRFPLNSAQAVTAETVGEHWDVNIGGANLDLGGAAVTNYSEIIDAGLDMVINAGSKSAQIPCSTTNSSNGLTCSAGSESFGIVIDITKSGGYEACASFTHQFGPNNGESVEAYFQWVETPNAAQTNLALGNIRVGSGCTENSTDAMACTSSNYVCGEFNFSSSGQKTLRLMYEMNVAGTIIGNNLLADRDASKGQRDIHIKVRKISEQKPTFAFTDLTASLGVRPQTTDADFKMDAAKIDGTSGTPLNTRNTGAWISTITDIGLGNYKINFSTAFSVSPMCFCTADASANLECNVGSISTTAATMFLSLSSTGANLDEDGYVWCIGKQ